MCANFKPIIPTQVRAMGLAPIQFEYEEDIYPCASGAPLLFQTTEGQWQWRQVMFGLVPKWAEDLKIARHTYNARYETIFSKPSFKDAANHFQFGVVPVDQFYETKIVDGKAQRWAVKRKDAKPIFIAALYQIARVENQIVRSCALLTMTANDHPIMNQFHSYKDEKRSVIVIPEEKLGQWLAHKRVNLQEFVQGFPVSEFECFYAPRIKTEKEMQASLSPQQHLF